MSDQIRIFVNGSALTVDYGTTVCDVVASFDPSLANAISDGSAYVTDGVGRRIEIAEPVAAGSILRIIHSSRKSGATRNSS